MRRETDDKLGRQGPHKLIQFLPAFIDHENWHLEGPDKNTVDTRITELTLMTCRADPGLFGDLVLFIDIYFVELDGRGRGVLRYSLKDRADCPTWAAPGSPEVNDYGFVAVYLISNMRIEGLLGRMDGETYDLFELVL